MVRNYIKKRAPYDEVTMQNAVKAVQSGTMGYLKASKVFGLKRETIRDQVRKRYQKMGAGRSTFLTAAEENEIEECLKIMARWGFGFTQSECLQLVGEYAKSKPNNPFKSSIPSNKRLSGFYKRHPNLTRRLPEQLKAARAKTSANENIVREWFNLVEQTLVEHNLQDCPHRIFNVDETGMPLDPKRMRVICEKNISHLFRVIGGSGRDSITVNGCASADGKMLPPYDIYAAKNLRSAWMENGPQGCRYTVSDKGWMDSVCFLDWFEKLFVPALPKERPVVLIFDGHKSHLSVPLIQSAVKHRVILLKLPPNSTHTLQPLDVGVYGPLKTEWEKILISFARQNLGTALSKEIFPSLLNKLWTSGCLSDKNILSGFSRCGIYPFNPNAVPRSMYESSEIFDKMAPSNTDTADALPTNTPNSPHTNSPGPSSPTPGPSSSPAGPSSPTPGPSSPTPGPSSSPAGPSSPTPGPSSPTPGPSSPTPGPSSSPAGPSSPTPGPSSPGPSSPTPGPSSPTPGPSSSVSPSSSRPETPSIKEFFMKRISPMLQAKRDQTRRKETVHRQYGESLTSIEYLERLTQEEEEKKNSKKGKGKRTAVIRNKRAKASKKLNIVDSESDMNIDDDNDRDWIPPRQRSDSDDEDNSDNDMNPRSQTDRNVFSTFQ